MTINLFVCGHHHTDINHIVVFNEEIVKLQVKIAVLK